MASMRNWIAGATTVLGILLVLSGAATIMLRTWWRPAPGDPKAKPAPTPAQATATELFGPSSLVTSASAGAARAGGLLGRLDAAERLIVWGTVLLVLAAVVAGAIGFDLGANAPVK
jgi:hypothetical protein